MTWGFSGAVTLVELDAKDARRIIELHEKYADLPIDFADATLVAISDRLEIREVLTLDGDFRIYRYRGRQRFRLPLLDA